MNAKTGRTADAEDTGMTKQPHGDEQQNPAPTEEEHGEGHAPNAHDGNLIQLPIGAEFELDHEPSPQEREDLVRYAAAADAELQGQGESVPPGQPERDRREDLQDEGDEE